MGYGVKLKVWGDYKDQGLSLKLTLRVVIGEKNFKNGKVEIKLRKEKEAVIVEKEKVIEKIMNASGASSGQY